MTRGLEKMALKTLKVRLLHPLLKTSEGMLAGSPKEPLRLTQAAHKLLEGSCTPRLTYDSAQSSYEAPLTQSQPQPFRQRSTTNPPHLTVLSTLADSENRRSF